MINQRSNTFKFFLVFLTFNFLLLTLPATVHAIEPIVPAPITPASPVYFLKAVKENLEIKLAKTKGEKLAHNLEFAGERLKEVKGLVNTASEELIQPTLERYLSHMDEILKLTDFQDSVSVTQLVDMSALHMGFFQEIYLKILNPTAQRSIRATVYRLSQWGDKSASKLYSLSNIQSAQQVIAVKQLGCNFLAKEASSAFLNRTDREVLSKRAKHCFEAVFGSI